MRLSDLKKFTRDTRDKVSTVVHRGRVTISERARQPVRADLPMPYERIEGHLFCIDGEIWGAYRLGEALWSYRSEEEMQRLLAMVTASYASLAGRTIQVLLDTKPFGALAWSSNYYRTAPDPAPAWENHVAICANQTVRIGLVDTAVGVMVKLGRRRKTETLLESIESDEMEVADQLRSVGLDAQPASSDDLAWFIHKAAAPGVQVPTDGLLGAVWAEEDMGEFSEPVEWEAAPLDRCVRVWAWRDGVRVESWATVLTLGRMGPRLPGRTPPWISAASRQPFPVSVVVTGELTAGSDAAKHVKDRHDWVTDNIAHNASHGIPSSPTLLRAQAATSALADRLLNGAPLDVAQFGCVTRFVVSAPTRRECLANAHTLTTYYRDHVKATLVHAPDQATALMSLRPGSERIKYGYRRQMDAALFAWGVPNVTGDVGNTMGMYLGYTSGDVPRRAVLHDPWHAMEHLSRAGMYLVLGDPGAGRSSTLLRILYESTLAGNYAVALDPASEWTTLKDVPEIADRVKIVDLAVDATPGMLAPLRLIPDPEREEGESVRDWESRLAHARQQRNEVLYDTLRTLIDPGVLVGSPGIALRQAASGADGDPWVVIDRLREDERNADLVAVLTDLARGSARIMFPDENEPEDLGDLFKSHLVVITMSGMEFPAPNSERANWDSAERTGAAVLNLAALLTKKLLLARPKHSKKILVVDEAHFLASWASGRAFVSSLVRHIRRWNLAIYLATQHPADIRKLDPSGKTFNCGGWVGFHESLVVARESFELLNIPAVYATVVPRLSWLNSSDRLPGEFIFKDDLGRVERMRVDRDYLASLTVASMTDPGKIVVPV